MEEIKKRDMKKIIIMLMILFTFFIINNNVAKQDKELKIVTVVDTLVIEKNKQTLELSEKAVFTYMKKINMRFPKVVYSQSKLESGNWNSRLFITQNNMFGMTKAGTRPHVQIHKEDSRYAYYESWQKSIIDYALYQSYVIPTSIKTADQYFDYLKKSGYAEDPNYIRKLKTMVESIDFENLDDETIL